MAELACLRRSFSQPSETSHDFSEGDPTRALGDSISFGRYMSETLAWEKWSTFSHNRYLEEAEKSSKPGSVAKMKAYFEAHYGKIGAKKQATFLQQGSDDSSFVESEVEDSQNVEFVSSLSSSSPALNTETTVPNSRAVVNELRRSLSSPALNSETAVASGCLTASEFPKDGTPNVESPLSVIVNSCDSSTQTKESENMEASIVEPILNTDYKECPPEVQVYQCEDAEVNARVTESSVEIKVNQSTDASESGINLTTPETKVAIEIEAKDKLEPISKQKPADSSLKSSKKSNVSKLASSLTRLASPVRPKKEGIGRLSNLKSAKESVENKKPASKLVQMSLNVDSDLKLMKSSPVSHKTGIGKVFTPLGKMIRQSIAHTPAQSTSRVTSVNSVSRHPSATPQSETRRSRVALEKSFVRNRTLNQKLESPSVGNMKSPAQSSITFAPFSFRTEERAAKRREFFERLEKEAETLKMVDEAKVKPRADFRKSSQSVNSSNAAVDIRREILSDKTKIPKARPQPPKCESKPSTNLARGKCSQPPRSNVGPKPPPANKSIHVTLSTKKKRHENASPNIL